MVYKFDLFLFAIPFGISEIFETLTNSMNLKITGTLLEINDDEPKILCAVVKNNKSNVTWERWRKEQMGTYSVIEARLENQRYLTKWMKPFLPRDPSHYTDLTKKVKWKTQPIDEGWEWVESWRPKVIEKVTDNEGWVYSKNFVGWTNKKDEKGTFDFVRSRFLQRKRISSFTGDTELHFDEHVKPKGSNLVDKIQYGIKIALMKDNRHNDFTTRTYFFLIDSNFNEYQFQDYAANAFLKIRKLHKINETEYVKAICENTLLGGETNEGGKSGQIFWRSFNNEFVIKTVTSKEAAFMQTKIRDYLEHLERNPNTLISRFFGLHKVKIGHTRIRFIVMNNVFSTCHLNLKSVYDLKGTTEDRLVKHNENSEKQPVLKDLNFADKYMHVTTAMSKAILEQIERDTNFFINIDVMDYSLLLGVAIRKEEQERESDEILQYDINEPKKRLNYPNGKEMISESSMFENGIKGAYGEVYYIGIIDLLQNWTKKKIFANTTKTCMFCDCAQQKIDSVPPRTYAIRFRDYFKTKIRDSSSSEPDKVSDSNNH